MPMGTTSSLRWDGFACSRLSEVWDQPFCDDERVREGEADGLVERFARHGLRTYVRAVGGSGVVDRVRPHRGVEISVVNCVLPEMDRRAYEADEGLLMLYASLSCDMAYRIDGQPTVVMNRPELTLVTIPPGMTFTIDVQGGVRQQRLFALFRHAALASILNLQPERLPQVLRDAAAGEASFGRIVSMPLTPNVASLVADTLDTPLQGEARALQYHGRLIELVAYALHGLQNQPLDRGHGGLRNQRDLELAHRARSRLASDYRKPPDLNALAHELATNANRLRSVFKAAFGVTMTEYCLERRMREAQQLLLRAELSIAQVAERVGYEYPSGFTAAFTDHVGMTPRDYRRLRAPMNIALGDPFGASASRH